MGRKGDMEIIEITKRVMVLDSGETDKLKKHLVMAKAHSACDCKFVNYMLLKLKETQE